MKKIDCRKLSCPEPVLRTKKALEESPGTGLQITVDNTVARDNVLRFARSRGLQAEWQQLENDFLITISGNGREQKLEQSMSSDVKEVRTSEAGIREQVALITSDQLGRGSEELGRLLMRNFIYTLTKQKKLPRTIIFMNSGVSLCADTSAVVEEVKLLESAGVEILVCGTCLDYYGLKESLGAGKISNMYDIAEILSTSVVITM